MRPYKTKDVTPALAASAQSVSTKIKSKKSGSEKGASQKKNITHFSANKSSVHAKHFKIGIVQSRFNDSITNALREACLGELIRLGVLAKHITLVQVPGALEIAITLQTLATRGEFDALIALGCVIRGETYHFELVSNESAAGINRVSLDHEIPIINAVITTENLVQALARQEEKGRDAAQAAVEMSHLLEIDL
jgi:6,7-dimethyl-8-ribityllumazine synthase